LILKFKQDMTMKRFVFCLMALLIPGSMALAQISNSEMELVKTHFNMEKKIIVTEFMALNDEDAAKFWPIYNDYEREKNEVANRRWALLNKYAAEYQNLSAEKVDEMMKESFSIQKKELAIKKKYYNTVKKNLSAEKAASFYQLEEYITTSVRLELMESIPFVGE